MSTVMFLERSEHWVKFSTGEITAIIGDNASDPPIFQAHPNAGRKDSRPLPGDLSHLPGYNGVWSLESVHRPANLFLPRVGGMNFEFVMDGHVGAGGKERHLIFEPRSVPMEMQVGGDGVVRLYQPPTPFWGIESWTEFSVQEPHSIDMKFDFSPNSRTWTHDWISVFWANYIYKPTPAESWLRIADDQGRVVDLGESREKSVIRSGDRLELARTGNWSERVISNGKVRFSQPFFFGVIDGMLFQVMVDTPHRLGFWSGSWHPPEHWEAAAWDFHFTVMDPQPGARYGMNARLVYTRWKGPDQPAAEYERWSSRGVSKCTRTC
ncbi:MAG: hypothetical protein HYU36_24975 [Planctomycetes bacterium]|nr:hypothetical protein [Planctomycetota bacterium]